MTGESDASPCTGFGARLSVIVPTLNPGAALERTLVSVLASPRPLGTDALECLVIDGGSVDGTLDLLDRLAAGRAPDAGPKLRWISEADIGVYGAMNRGVALASGEWLYFLGAGDRLRTGVWKSVSAMLHAGDCDLLYGDVFHCGAGCRIGGVFHGRRLASDLMPHQGMIYRRQVFERLGCFPLDYPVFADAALNPRIFGDPGLKTRYVPLTLADYQGGGISAYVGGRKDPAFGRDYLHLVGDYLGRQAWDAAVDSGFALDFRLRNSRALSLLLVADAAAMPAARHHLEERAELFKTALRLREQPLTGSAQDTNAWERALTGDEEATVLFTTQPIPWDNTGRDGRLLRGTFLRHRWDLLPALSAKDWRGVWVFGTGEAGQALLRQLRLARAEGQLQTGIRGFLDRDPARMETSLMGLPVKLARPDLLAEDEGVVLATMAWLDVKDWLVDSGFAEDQLLMGC